MIKGQDVQVIIYSNGEVLKTIAPISFEYNLEMEVTRTKRIGSRVDYVDTAGPRGYEGSIVFEMETFELEDFDDIIIQKHLDGRPVDRVDIIQTLTSPTTGKVRNYVYKEALLVPSSSVSDSHENVKKTYKWKSGLRTIL